MNNSISSIDLSPRSNSSFHPLISTTHLDVKFSEAISTKDSCCRIFSCSMMACRSGSVLSKGSFKAVAHDLVSEVMLLWSKRRRKEG